MGPDWDHPQNGLLLRRDLHALFDAGLLAIDPRSKRAHFAKLTRNYPEYRRLHGKPLYNPNESRYQPSLKALERRWKEFQRRWKKFRE